jgi:lysophospholipase L1-like esterase
MPVNSPALPKRILFYSITILILLVIMELFSRAYYYQQLSRHKIAAIQVLKDVRNQIGKRLAANKSSHRIHNDNYLVRPEFSHAENDEVAREGEEANLAVYEPWVGFAFRDFTSKYVNVTGHVRKSIPELSDSLAKQPVRIFFLGGSTTYGFNVTDAETIPSAFVRAYRQKYPGGRPIQVTNLAMPGYYSYQELILLADRLFRDDRPDMVIMLDGLNDCYQASTSYNREPLYTPGIGELANPASEENLPRLLNSFKLPGGMSEDSACKMIGQRYLANIRNARILTAAYSIPLYCFWQPVPYYNYPNRRNDPVARQDDAEQFGKIYPLVKSAAGEIPYLFFLGDMLQDEKGLPFIDQIHYSPRFNQVIAEKMLSRIDFEDQK